MRGVTDPVEERLGRVELSPHQPVVAGRFGEWTLVYTVGSYGIDEGGTLKVARRFASDWQRPQFDDPKGEAYTTVRTDGEASLRVRYDHKAHVRPWMKCLVIDIYDGCLSPGDTVTIVFGDRSEGSPGIRAQSFIESAHEMRFLVDPTNACLVRRIPSSPVVPIVADEPTSVVVIGPTRPVVGQPAVVFAKGEDRWGNPTPVPEDAVFRWDGEDHADLDDMTLRFERASRGRVVGTWRGKSYVSNPISAEDAPRYGAYWADLHAQSDATVGTGSEWEYFTFGRDWAHLDVMSHQGNDFQVTDEVWARLNEVVRRFHQDGHFVVFPGFEWSANTPAGGDRNVIYLEEGQPIMRSSHWQTPGVRETELTPAHPASGLYAALRKHVDPSKVLVAAHCGGRYADIRKYFDQELESLVEVSSCWGVFEWLLWDAFEKGYRVGIMCNSDGHKGRPGAEGPGAGQFGIYGGLTCILAESLTRASCFEALKSRRCYGTTGARIDLRLEVDGQPMGSDLRASGDVAVVASAAGAIALDRLELYCGRQRVKVVRPAAFEQLRGSRRIRLMWGGARIRGRGRRAAWDGTITVTGAKIERAQTVAFDSPADGIASQSEHSVELRSRTTGDVDGIDLWLDQATRGTVSFESKIGTLKVDLATMTDAPVAERFGGLDLEASIERYPETPEDRVVRLETSVEVSGDSTTPIWVKAIQVDGEMAWASPVYVDVH